MPSDETPEVIHELVRVLGDPSRVDELSNEDLYAIGYFARQGRSCLREAVAELNRRGITFAQIGAYYGVTESTASRWAKPGNRS